MVSKSKSLGTTWLRQKKWSTSSLQKKMEASWCYKYVLRLHNCPKFVLRMFWYHPTQNSFRFIKLDRLLSGMPLEIWQQLTVDWKILPPLMFWIKTITMPGFTELILPICPESKKTKKIVGGGVFIGRYFPPKRWALFRAFQACEKGMGRGEQASEEIHD